MNRPLFTIKFLLIAIGYCLHTWRRDNSSLSKKIIAKLTPFSTNHPAGKVYLQFDKLYYAAGDTIYFKTYRHTNILDTVK